MVDNLGDWVISGTIELLVNFIQCQHESRFVMAGRIPLPSQLLPYKLTSQINIYGKSKLQYSAEEVMEMYSGHYKGSKELFNDFYDLCHGMPLFMAVAQGFLEGVTNDEASTFRKVL